MSDMKKSVDEKISEALNLNFDNDNSNKELDKPKVTEIVVNKELQLDDDQKSDYTLVRNNLKEIIATGQSAIEGILNVADEGEAPRAYEVVSQLINTVASANKDLIDLHKKFKDLRVDTSETAQQAGVTNNSIYVGSTKELQDLVNQSRSASRRIAINEDDIIDGEVVKENDSKE